LFIRSVGDSSDIVRKQTFDLVNKGSAKDYTLRPEFTAGIVRSVIENKLYASPDLPLKYVYSGTVYRYERPGTGRLREFRQFGVEVFDKKLDYSSQAEVILLAYNAAKLILNKELNINVNCLGSEESRKKYVEALINYFSMHIDNMCDDCKERIKLNPLRILDCKVESDQILVKDAPIIIDYLSDDDKNELYSVVDVLTSLGINVKIDDRLVRGLDYYTGIVFEIYDPTALEFGAIGGGGKYSGLMAQLGGPDMEGIGFSFGVDRLLLAAGENFKPKKEIPNLFVIPMAKNKDCQMKAIKLANELRMKNLIVILPSFSKGINGCFKMADRLNCRYALLINEDLTLELKDLEQRVQTPISEKDLLERSL